MSGTLPLLRRPAFSRISKCVGAAAGPQRPSGVLPTSGVLPNDERTPMMREGAPGPKWLPPAVPASISSRSSSGEPASSPHGAAPRPHGAAPRWLHGAAARPHGAAALAAIPRSVPSVPAAPRPCGRWLLGGRCPQRCCPHALAMLPAGAPLPCAGGMTTGSDAGSRAWGEAGERSVLWGWAPMPAARSPGAGAGLEQCVRMRPARTLGPCAVRA
jgi:hypothetical protein